jgi:large subunit ribosomal protein L5
MTSMCDLKIEKITLNVGAGKDQALLEKGMKLLKLLTGIDPIKTVTKKRIPSWGLRPGLPVGCKITIRDKKKINDMIMRLLKAKEQKLPLSCFDDYGNVSFGLHEYIDIPGIEYDPDIGIIGFEISITFEKSGYSIKRKSFGKKKIGKKHLIKREETMAFMKENFNVDIDM